MSDTELKMEDVNLNSNINDSIKDNIIQIKINIINYIKIYSKKILSSKLIIFDVNEFIDIILKFIKNTNTGIVIYHCLEVIHVILNGIKDNILKSKLSEQISESYIISFKQ